MLGQPLPEYLGKEPDLQERQRAAVSDLVKEILEKKQAPGGKTESYIEEGYILAQKLEDALQRLPEAQPGSDIQSSPMLDEPEGGGYF